ncbi:MAG: hypothetical protein HY904_19190 [Deltaproteobacteria bacterium]|nr:hypothetical protein [Deltaproteobacteria bacterium]
MDAPTTNTAWDRLRARGASWLGGLVALLLLAPWIAWNRWEFVFRLNEPRNFVWSDMQGYVERAVHLATPGIKLTRFDTFYPPGTHLLMTPLMRVAANEKDGLLLNQWLWWVLAVVTLYAVAGLGWKLFRHPLAGALAVGGLMFHWPFTIFAGLYMSENPFTCFMALSLLVGLFARDLDEARPWRRAAVYALAGLLAGVATVIRPQYALGAATIGFPLLTRRFPFVRVREAVPLLLAFLLPVLPAMELQSHAAGTRVGLSSNAGFNFYQGHCDVVHIETHEPGVAMYYTFAAPVSIQRAQREGREEKKAIHRKNMAWDNAYYFQQGWECIRQDGWAHARRWWANLEDMFGASEPWPPNITPFAKGSATMNRLYSHALLFLLPVALLLARWRRAERWLLLQLATLTPIMALFYGDSRYRIPYDMFGYLLLAGLMCSVFRLRRDPRRVPGLGWTVRSYPAWRGRA